MLKQKENNDIYEREYTTRTKHSELSKPKLIAEFSGPPASIFWDYITNFIGRYIKKHLLMRNFCTLSYFIRKCPENQVINFICPNAISFTKQKRLLL